MLKKSGSRLRLDRVKAERCALSPRLTVAVTVLACIALAASCYLAWVGLTSSKVVGCDGGVFDCSHVLTSRWSVVLGIPVGVPAAGLYASMLVAIAVTCSAHRRRRERAVRVMCVLSLTAALAALWFISLQLASIGRLCPYCLVVHGCGMALAALVWHSVNLGRGTMFRSLAVAIALVAGLVVSQLASDGPQTYVIEEMPAAPENMPAGTEDVFEAPMLDAPDLFEAPQAEGSTSRAAWELSGTLRMPPLTLIGVVMAPQGDSVQEESAVAPAQPKLVAILGGTKTLDAGRWPLWGNGTSDRIFVEMFDYTCSHCRNTHRAIKEASRQLGGDVAIIALPVPLHRACNDAATSNDPQRAGACEIARIAVAVWLTDRSKFTGFHDWLFEQSRSPEEARRYAEVLVGAAKLREQLEKPTASQYIARHVDLYKQMGSGTVPKLIFPTTTIVGEITSGSTIAEMVREKLR